MDLNQARFTLTDVIKIATAIIVATFAWATIKNDVGNVADSVGEIRVTQVENTRKNEVRWQVTEARLNQIESNQRLFEQRLKQLEVK